MARRPRVLVLNHFAAPLGQPGGTRHVELFSKLSGWDYLIVASDRNHQTGEVVPAEPGFRTVRTISYTSNGFRRILNWISYAVMAVLYSMRLKKFDIVYASSPHLLTGLAGWMIAKLRRIPFVLEIRDLWPKILVDMGQMSDRHPVYILLVALENFLYRQADHIVVMAPGTQVELESRGIQSNKISYIPNGADPEDFKPSDDRDALRTKYGFSGLTAIYAGAHGPANGLDLLLDAAAEVTDLPLTIVLVGSGVEKTRLMARATSEGLRNIRFMDSVNKSEIPNLLHASDVGIHVLADVPLFQTAVSPNKIFDYMASGLPIITNCPGYVSNLISKSRSGWTTTPGALASPLRAVGASSPSLRKEFGSNGQAWLQEHQSRTAMSNKLQTMLKSLLVSTV